jgi:hypothetical protein
MNILQFLQRFRDDFKAWVTVNLKALDKKIDDKTFPVDTKLSSTSKNPVQNKVINAELDDLKSKVGNTPVANQISDAMAKYTHFSGDYNDLINAPNIVEDESGDLAITDENGNIILKVDADGLHSTALTLDGKPAATEMYVDSAIAEIPTPDVSGQINAHNVSDTAHEDIRQAINTAKEELNEAIVSETAEFHVADNAGNIVATVNENGVTTTTVNAQDVVINGTNINDMFAGIVTDTSNQIAAAVTDAQIYTDSAIDKIDFPDTDLTGYATEDYVDAKVADLVSSAPEHLDTLGALATAVESNEERYEALLETVATHTDVEDLKAELGEAIDSETSEFHIVDNTGNIIASVNADGITTTTVNAQNIIINNDSVAEHLNNTTIHVTEAERVAWNKKSDFSGNYADLTNAPDITEDESGDLVIADANGNIIFRSNSTGLETVNLIVESIVINGKSIQDMIREYIEEIISNK